MDWTQSPEPKRGESSSDTFMAVSWEEASGGTQFTDVRGTVTSRLTESDYQPTAVAFPPLSVIILIIYLRINCFIQDQTASLLLRLLERRAET